MRKVRTGAVVRTGMQQTAVVEMVWKQRHRLYRKPVRRVTRFYVHDPLNQCQVGDTVRIQETRPISKTKHWRLLEILHRRQVAEVQPIELEADLDAAIAGTEDEDSPEEAVGEVEEEVADASGESDAGEEPAVAEVEDAGNAGDDAAEAAAEAGGEKDA